MGVVNHPAFQRLGEIYQLGQTHLVYRGATHKRFEHAIGTVHVAQLMIDAIERNCEDAERQTGKWSIDRKLNDAEVAFVRLGALLHDIGHLPAGHTLEDELGLLDLHDSDKRLKLILDRTTWRGQKYERSLRSLIDEKYRKLAELTEVMNHGGGHLSGSEILCLLVSKDYQEHPVVPSNVFRLSVCRDIIGNTICADLLDYLHRDWLHLGKPRHFDTRLLEYMEIRRAEESSGPDSRLVINLREGKSVRTDAATAIMDLLESRYQLSEIALFHRTKLCAAAMLERVVAELADSYKNAGESALLDRLTEDLLDTSDTEMLGLLEKLTNEAIGSADEEDKVRLEGCARLVHKLRLRELHKEFHTEFEYQLAATASWVQDTYSGPKSIEDRTARAKEGAANRLTAVRLLEKDFGLRPGSLVMYCPPRKMNTKIAEVQVLVHRAVYTLDDFESESADKGVTGGHLAAQKTRFTRLWRVLIAIDRTAREDLREKNLLQKLGSAIKLLVLNELPAGGITQEEATISLAKELSQIPGSPLHGKQILESIPIAARTGSSSFYPGGAPSLLDFIEH